jgi:isochorismate pyruvate lyase
LGDIRACIDALDFSVIDILARRMQYVHAAIQFKPDQASIPAPERVAEMLIARRHRAEQAGLDPDFIEGIFCRLIDWYISNQIAYWREKKGGNS